MEDASTTQASTERLGAPLSGTSPHLALDLKSAAGDGRLYFCVIDRLCYQSMETALAHVRMQHGVSTRGELLLRAKMLGGGL